jgi:hypothetical protein
MSLTKKDFISLADKICENPDAFNPESIKAIVEFCKEQNPRFKEQTLYDYIHKKLPV